MKKIENTRICISVISIMLGISSLVQADSQIPVLCDTALQQYSDTLGATDALKPIIDQCRDLFGQCGTSQNGQNSIGIQADILAQLVKNVVGTRIANLYNGINSLFSPSGTLVDGVLRYPMTSQIWSQRSTRGFCGNTNACNLFCGEGSNAAQLSASLLPNGLPLDTQSGSQGRHGKDPFYKIDDLPGNLADQDPKISDFMATGVSNDGSSAPPATLTSINMGRFGSFKQTVIQYNQIPGWPTHKFTWDTNPAVQACGQLPDDQGNGLLQINQDDVKNGLKGSVGSQKIYTTPYYYNIDSISWDDGTFLGPGNASSCDMFYLSDYSQASVISSFQLGALIQLNWMMLAEVKSEIESGTLRVSTVCQPLANDYLNSFRLSVTALQTAKACGRKLSDVDASCKTEKGVSTQSDCYIAAAITTLQGLSFSKIAECEVYQRSNSYFEKLFINSDLTTSGAPYVAQLKNWAVAGCLIANLHNTNQTVNENKDTEDELRFLTAQYPKGLNNCFPYAYTAAMYSYLTKNTIIPLKSTPLQENWTSPAQNALGDRVPPIQLNQCRLTQTQAQQNASSKKEPNSNPLLLTALSLFFQKSNKRRKRKKKESFLTAESRQFLLSLSVIFIFSGSLLIIFGTGCNENDTTQIRIYSFVNNQCVGQNGILQTGASTACCSYAKIGKSDYTSESSLQGMIDHLKGALLSSPPSGVTCAGPISDIFVDLGLRVSEASITTASLVKVIQNLASGSGTPNSNTLSSPSPLSNLSQPTLPGMTQQGGAATAGGSGMTNPASNALPLSGGLTPLQGSAQSGSGGNSGSNSAEKLSFGSVPNPSSTPTSLLSSTLNTASQALENLSGVFRSKGFRHSSSGGESPLNVPISSEGISQEARFERKETETGETVDPENYFERSQKKDSLFKMIEEKYRQKTPLLQ